MTHLTTSDGVSLRARTWAPHRSSSTTVVLVHGFSASKDHPEVVAVAEALAAAGFGVISYDARGHNESDGLCTLGDTERLDVAAAVAAARSRSERVVAVGASMGAIAVLRHAGTDATLDGSVVVSAPARWKVPWNLQGLFSIAMSRTRAGRAVAARYLGVRIHDAWNHPPAPLDVAAGIRSPLAVIHGDADRLIPFSEAHRLASGAAGPTRLDIVEKMGHAFDPKGIPSIVAAVHWALEQGRDTPRLATA